MIFLGPDCNAKHPDPPATPNVPDPVIGSTKPADMHCAITQYQQWIRAQTKPPEPDAKARKLQEIDDLCGSSLHLAHVQSGYEVTLSNAAGKRSVTPSALDAAGTAVPAAPPAVQTTKTAATTTAHGRIKSKEVVSSVLIAADGTRLVIVTAQFHYIFEMPAPLLAALKQPFHAYVQAKFSEFHVEIPGATTGTVSLSVSSAPDDAVASAIAAGFTKTPDGAEYATTLHGFRYTAGDIKVGEQYILNKTYEIEVDDDLKNYRKPSPITMAAGYLTFYGILLVVAPQVIFDR